MMVGPLTHRDGGPILPAGQASATVGTERLSGLKELSFYAVYGPDAVVGCVLVEGAHSENYTGQWARLLALPWMAPGRVVYGSITGTHLAIRIRVSEPVIGDTVAVYAAGS